MMDLVSVQYFVLGVATCALSYVLLRDLITADNVVRENYSGRKIPSLGGLVVLCALFTAKGISIAFSDHATTSSFGLSALIVTIGYAFIGLLDDVIGDKHNQGFKGHIKALLSGSMTTGALKLFGGPAIALFAFAPGIESRGFVPVIVDSLAVALIANFFNLLDLAPGRTSKFMTLAVIAIIIVEPQRHYIYAILGVLVVTLFLDVREKFMLGDTGANLFGALIGFYAVTSVSDRTAIVLLVVALLANALSEFVSFSTIINRVMPLRYFDYAGQLPARREWAENRRKKTI